LGQEVLRQEDRDGDAEHSGDDQRKDRTVERAEDLGGDPELLASREPRPRG
jgi:hypothetical protein